MNKIGLEVETEAAMRQILDQKGAKVSSLVGKGIGYSEGVQSGR